MRNKRYSKDITSESITGRHYITTTKKANLESKVIGQLDMFEDGFIKQENYTTFALDIKNKALIENGQIVVKFNDDEVLKTFDNQKTIDNIQHLNTILIDRIYRHFYFKTRIKDKKPVIEIEEKELKKFVSKNVIQVREFLRKYKIYNDNCLIISTYKDKDNKTILERKYIPKFFIGDINIIENGKYKKLKWTFEINKQFEWNEYLKQFIDIPEYLLTYTGLKEQIIKNIFRQLRMQKQTKITLTINQLIENSGLFKPSNLHDKRNRIIKPIEKALKEITENKEQVYIKMDLSKINNIDLTKFINSKVEITVVYKNYFLLQETTKEQNQEEKKEDLTLN